MDIFKEFLEVKKRLEVLEACIGLPKNNYIDGIQVIITHLRNRIEELERKQAYTDEAYASYLSWERSGVVEQMINKIEKLEKRIENIEIKAFHIF